MDGRKSALLPAVVTHCGHTPTFSCHMSSESTPMLPLKFAFRTLAKTPFITAVAVVSLAFGIGANSAIFSIFNQMLLESVPAA